MLFLDVARVDYKASFSEKVGRNSRIPYRALLSVLTVAFVFRITMQPLVGKWQMQHL